MIVRILTAELSIKAVQHDNHLYSPRKVLYVAFAFDEHCVIPLQSL